MKTIDISELEFQELAKLRAEIDGRMLAIKQASLGQLRDRFQAEATDVGLTLDEVMGTTKKRRGRKPKQPPAESSGDT